MACARTHDWSANVVVLTSIEMSKGNRHADYSGESCRTRELGCYIVGTWLGLMESSVVAHA